MQTSKIIIGDLYAIKDHRGLPVRFKVTQIISRKTTNGGNAVNTVSGYRIKDGAGQRGAVEEVDPQEILGKFEEYAELVAQQNAEKAAKEAAEQAKVDAGKRIAELLYKATGLPRWEPFRVRHDGTVDISPAANEALLTALEAAFGKEEVETP